MKFEIENNVISSYKRLSYDAWYAFAEFVDNSTQSYFDNKKELDAELERTGKKLNISIDYDRGTNTITVRDNSIGMDEKDLERAFKVGQPPPNPTGRSKYGLGMKTAACWFGNKWQLKTKRIGRDKGYIVKIDVAQIANQIGEVILAPEEFDSEINEHYTVLTITDLNRQFLGRTLWKIKDFLSSIYRFDITAGIEISWNGTPLEWTGLDSELHVAEDGSRYKKQFQFEVNGKIVKGWVGVLGKGYGSRKKAGFSIIQSNRVIQSGYKPSSIFGEQEDGTNDLINQRLVGELQLDAFSVSHTKDKIVWEDDEEDDLNLKLGEYSADAKELALTMRFKKDAPNLVAKFKEEAITILSSELKSSELKNYLTDVDPVPEKIIAASHEKASDAVIKQVSPDLEVTVGYPPDEITVLVFFSEKSEFDPYILTETTVESNRVIIIVNTIHPHVQEMTSSDSFLNFLRHCIYDGVAEWKAVKLRGSINPYTVKFLKDGLLRVPFEIKANKAV
jgi:hypothetical protein